MCNDGVVPGKISSILQMTEIESVGETIPEAFRTWSNITNFEVVRRRCSVEGKWFVERSDFPLQGIINN